VTLRDAGEYISALPKAEQDKPHWQAATEALPLVVESKTGPAMFARLGLMQALMQCQPKAEPGARRKKKAKPVRIIR